MITMAHRELDDVEARLCYEWHGIRDSAAIASTLAAEHMRALIYGAYADHRQLSAPAPSIHTARLLASARRAVGLLWPKYGHDPSKPDVCEVMLDSMKALGDVVDIGSGQWLAAPLRIVAAEDRSGYLILGAAPAAVIHQALGVAPIYAGASRIVDAEGLDAKTNYDLVLSLDTWLGHHQSLVSWTAKLLTHFESQMKALEGLSTEHLELYAPDVMQAQRRSGRWIAARQVSHALTGPRLCRPLERYSPKWGRPSYLAHFEHAEGGLTLRRAVQVPADTTLRLRFGLDTTMRTPRRIAITWEGDTFSIDRPLMLPSPEGRIYALGWSAPGESTPDCLRFHAKAMPFVVHALQRIHVSLAIDGVTS